MATETERCEFTGAFGDRLSARLDRPSGPPVAYALLAHCFTCSKDLKGLRTISRALAREGIAVLRFDFTGLGQSEGEFAGTNFSSNVDDLVAAAAHLREEHEAPRLLVGHSLGGAAVLVAAERIEETRAVATIGAPSSTDHLGDRLREMDPGLEEGGETAELEFAGRSFEIRRQLLEDLGEQSVRGAVEGLGLPLLLFHSPLDDVVDVDHARRIFEAALHPKSFVSLDRADHLLLEDEADARFCGSVLARWARRYVGEEDEEVEGLPRLEHGRVLVRGGAEGYRQAIAAGPHRLVADEPEDVGGTDAGPTPYELLLAGLGACTNMTLRMYADRKEWDLENVTVRLRHERVHADDCAACETEEGSVDRIERVLEMAGDLSAEQRERLLEIAGRCPVGRTLESETRIGTRSEE